MSRAEVTDTETDVHWRPAIGDVVWFNYPDHDEPEGRVVGYTQDFGAQEGDRRYDQPVILGPKKLGFMCREPIDPSDKRLFVVHPMFLLPFRYGGTEWQQANAEGRIK